MALFSHKRDRTNDNNGDDDNTGRRMLKDEHSTTVLLILESSLRPLIWELPPLQPLIWESPLLPLAHREVTAATQRKQIEFQACESWYKCGLKEYLFHLNLFSR